MKGDCCAALKLDCPVSEPGIGCCWLCKPLPGPIGFCEYGLLPTPLAGCTPVVVLGL